jgi:hypothetical protein
MLRQSSDALGVSRGVFVALWRVDVVGSIWESVSDLHSVL